MLIRETIQAFMRTSNTGGEWPKLNRFSLLCLRPMTTDLVAGCRWREALRLVSESASRCAPFVPSCLSFVRY